MFGKNLIKDIFKYVPRFGYKNVQKKKEMDEAAELGEEDMENI